MQARLRRGRVHSGSLGSFGRALLVVSVHSCSFGRAQRVAGLIRVRWVHSRRSMGSFGFDRFIGARLRGPRVAPWGLLGSYWHALRVVGFIRVR